MGESTKAVFALFLIVALSVGALAWFADRPDAMTWTFRIGGPLFALLALGVIVKLQFRTDAAHDYLRKFAGTYFNRDGFCFAFSANAAEGIAYLNIYFGNQYDQLSVGRVALRPAQNFFHGRANFDLITCEIQCPPAAFGVAQIAVAVPLEKLT